jgi:calnexin
VLGTLLLLFSCALSTASDAQFFEDFEGKWASRWIHSEDEKYSGRFETDTPKDLNTAALKVPEKAKHYGITALLDKPVDPAEGLVLQYDLKTQDGISCGGAYLKFLTDEAGFNAKELKDGTPYSVMFGPDKCGATNKVHLILRHKGPNGEIEEKHLSSPPSLPYGEGTHVYTAILSPDNTYQILIDGEEKKAGSIFEDFTPAINPPKEIEDKDDKKPEDWVDEPSIPDPEAVKPDDWDDDAPQLIDDMEAKKPEGWLDDEPTEIDDPDAEKPEDWDEEEDGEWERPKVPNPKCTVGCGEWQRPQVPNPAYKGKWSAPVIDNPAYKGVWKPRMIPNPDYVADETPLANIGKVGAVAIEIWTMDKDIFFDNILVTNSADVAAETRESTFKSKIELEEAAKKKRDEEAASAKLAEDDEDDDEDEDEYALDKTDFADGTSYDAVFQRMSWILNRPIFKAVRPYIQPHLKKAAKSVMYGVLFLAIPAVLVNALLVYIVYFRNPGGPATTAAADKKTDTTRADDTPIPDTAAEGSSAAPKKEKVLVREGEDKAEVVEDEDEAPEATAGARRRTRREM